MSISDRYRQLIEDIRTCCDLVEGTDAELGPEERLVAQALQEVEALADRVGDIPRIRLESQLTPVLLKAHNLLDRARLILEEAGKPGLAADVWDRQQIIYRLLNDL